MSACSYSLCFTINERFKDKKQCASTNSLETMGTIYEVGWYNIGVEESFSWRQNDSPTNTTNITPGALQLYAVIRHRPGRAVLEVIPLLNNPSTDKLG